ncbi:amidase family protein [Thermoproteota archaeon]
MIKEFVEKIKAKEIDVVQHTKKVLNEAKKINDEFHYFNTISEDLAMERAKKMQNDPKGRLAGVPISVKDCIVVKGVESTAGSRILKGYKPVFNATVVRKCIDEGAIIIGKTAQDTFGFGSFSTNVGLDYDIPLNPFDKLRATGGSSGGSGGISQKADFPHVSIAESTGGSIEAPASFCGVFGFCPTYGRVSRYGLMDYANSLDKIGPMAKNIEDVALVLEIISGHTSRDSTVLNKPVDKYTDYVNKGVKGMKIGVVKEAFGQGVDESVKNKVWDAIKKLESQGASYEEVSLPLTTKYGLPAYYIIATSETSTNLAKYCGMRYGNHEKLEGGFNEYFTKVRSSHFNKEAKRRIILGTFARMAGFRDAYYLKAMKVRTRIIQEYKSLFKKFDVLATPTMPMLAPRFDEIEKLTPLQNYMADIMTCGPNFAGMPHASIPVGFGDLNGRKLPVGMMLTGDHLNEGKVIQAGSCVNK